MKRTADYLTDTDFSSEILESLGLGMIVVRANWTLLACNETVASWTGLSADALEKQPLTEHAPRLTDSRIATALETAMQSGAPATLNSVAAGDFLPFSPANAEAGRAMALELHIHRSPSDPDLALIILRDITAALALRTSTSTDDTELTSTRPNPISGDNALAPNSFDGEQKNEFVAKMSHEIRCLMTPILGYADLLADDPSPANVPVAVDTIRRNGQHLLDMLDDVLDLARLDATSTTIKLESIDPRQIASDVVTMMRARAEAKGLTINTESSGPLPFTIQTDPTRVRQVLLNLITNAVKFTESGGITIRIHLVDQDPMRRQIAFDVIDTGSGLAPEQVEHLFRPFVYLHDSTTCTENGTGLGLTIGRTLARMLGGDITVAHSGPEGSTFRFHIATDTLDGVPLIEHDAPEAASPMDRHGSATSR